MILVEIIIMFQRKAKKKMKKGKHPVTANLTGNISSSFQEDSSDTVAAKVFIAGIVGSVCIALLAGLYIVLQKGDVDIKKFK